MTASTMLRLEAWRLARIIVKDAIRAEGHKLSSYTGSEIDRATKIVLRKKIAIWSIARANLKRRAKDTETLR